MHVALFNRSFYPDTAATGQLLTELAEGLVHEHGCRVTAVAGVPLLPAAAGNGRRPRPSLLLSRERHRGIDILRARGTRFSKRRFAGRFANYVSYFLSAAYAGLRVARPDVVVAATDPPIIGLAGWLCARRFRAPFVMSYRDIFPEGAVLLEDFHSEAVNRVLQGVNEFLVRAADRNVALGGTMRRRLVEGKGADPAKTIVIPDWIDCSEIVPRPKRSAFAEAHGLTDRFVVMHSGNIGLTQGLDAVVDAAAFLRGCPDLEVVFVGDGVKRPALEARARTLGLGNVRFLPYQPKERLVESFAAADLFVVSLKRGLAGYVVPSKLYGILAAGRPYVAAVEEESEVAEISGRWRCGLVAEPGEPKEIAERILRFYHDRDLLRECGERARTAGLEFDRPRHVAAYYELFRALTRRPAARKGGGWHEMPRGE